MALNEIHESKPHRWEGGGGLLKDIPRCESILIFIAHAVCEDLDRGLGLNSLGCLQHPIPDFVSLYVGGPFKANFEINVHTI